MWKILLSTRISKDITNCIKKGHQVVILTKHVFDSNGGKRNIDIGLVVNIREFNMIDLFKMFFKTYIKATKCLTSLSLFKVFSPVFLIVLGIAILIVLVWKLDRWCVSCPMVLHYKGEMDGLEQKILSGCRTFYKLVQNGVN